MERRSADSEVRKKKTWRLTKAEVPRWNGGVSAEARNIKEKKWREDCRARIFSSLKELNSQRLPCNQEESTEEEEMKQLQRMMIIKTWQRK